MLWLSFTVCHCQHYRPWITSPQKLENPSPGSGDMWQCFMSDFDLFPLILQFWIPYRALSSFFFFFFVKLSLLCRELFISRENSHVARSSGSLYIETGWSMTFFYWKLFSIFLFSGVFYELEVCQIASHLHNKELLTVDRVDFISGVRSCFISASTFTLEWVCRVSKMTVILDRDNNSFLDVSIRFCDRSLWSIDCRQERQGCHEVINH